MKLKTVGRCLLGIASVSALVWLCVQLLEGNRIGAMVGVLYLMAFGYFQMTHFHDKLHEAMKRLATDHNNALIEHARVLDALHLEIRALKDGVGEHDSAVSYLFEEMKGLERRVSSLEDK